MALPCLRYRVSKNMGEALCARTEPRGEMPAIYTLHRRRLIGALQAMWVRCGGWLCFLGLFGSERVRARLLTYSRCRDAYGIGK